MHQKAMLDEMKVTQNYLVHFPPSHAMKHAAFYNIFVASHYWTCANRTQTMRVGNFKDFIAHHGPAFPRLLLNCHLHRQRRQRTALT